MIDRIRQSLTDTIELAVAKRLENEIRKGNVHAILTWSPNDPPAYRLEITRTQSESTDLSFSNEAGAQMDGRHLLYPTTTPSRATEIGNKINHFVQIGEAVWTLDHKTGPIHGFRVELNPPESSAVYIDLQATTKQQEGDNMEMHVAEKHPDG